MVAESIPSRNDFFCICTNIWPHRSHSLLFLIHDTKKVLCCRYYYKNIWKQSLQSADFQWTVGRIESQQFCYILLLRDFCQTAGYYKEFFDIFVPFVFKPIIVVMLKDEITQTLSLQPFTVPLIVTIYNFILLFCLLYLVFFSVSEKDRNLIYHAGPLLGSCLGAYMGHAPLN